MLVAGSVVAFARFAVELFRGRKGAYQGASQGVGRAILLGIEILIIADIVQTITVDPTLESAVALGVDRAGSDVPQLLHRDRARGSGSVAPGRLNADRQA